MSTVSDLMSYLNSKFGFNLPVLPLSAFTQAMSAIWKSTVKNWVPGDTPPETITVEIKTDTTIPLGSGAFSVKSCTISITNLPSNDTDG